MEVKGEFLARTQLRTVPGNMFAGTGRVRIYKPFWRDAARLFGGTAQPDLVPPILAYADLVATADPRNLEAAKMIYDEYIARYN